MYPAATARRFHAFKNCRTRAGLSPYRGPVLIAACGHAVASVPLNTTVTASICEQPAFVNYAGLVGPGLNQFNITVPSVPAGTCSIVLSMQGLSTQSGVMIPTGP